MAHYPVNLDLEDKRCLVVGGGEVAERKVEMLLDFGGRVVVIAPELTPRLESLAADSSVEHVACTYRPGMLKGAFLVIAATDEPEVNHAVAEEARHLGILVNVVDDPDFCSFFVPAVVRRGDLVIAVSTSGRSPSLARRLRERLEEELTPAYGDLADLLGELRDEVKAKYSDPADRTDAYCRILDSETLSLLSEGKRDEAIERARKCI